MGLGSVERFVARRYPQYDWPFNDVDGSGLLVCLSAQLRLARAVLSGNGGSRCRDEHFSFVAVDVDELASAVAALAA